MHMNSTSSTSSGRATVLDKSLRLTEPALRLKGSQISVALGLSTAALTVVAMLSVDRSAFWQGLYEVRLWALSFSIGLLAMRFLVGGARLRYISEGRVSFAVGVKGQMIWDLFSNVVPPALGGGPFCAAYLSREGRVSYGQSSAYILYILLIDHIYYAILVALLLAISPFLPLFPSAIGTAGMTAFLGLFAAMVIWVVLLGITVFVRPELLESIVMRVLGIPVLKRFAPRVSREMSDLRRAARFLRDRPVSFFVNSMLLTVWQKLSKMLLPVSVVLAFSPYVDRLLALVRTAAMSIAWAAMPTPGGSGGAEGFFVLFLGPPLLPETLVVPAMVLWRALGFYGYIAIGLVALLLHLRRRPEGTHDAEAFSVDRSKSADVPLPARNTISTTPW